MAGMPSRDAAVSQSIPIEGTGYCPYKMHHLINRECLLGENLYSLVDQLEQEVAAKVTCVLLKVGQTEVLRLLRQTLK